MQGENAELMVCVREREHGSIFCISDVERGVCVCVGGGGCLR